MNSSATTTTDMKNIDDGDNNNMLQTHDEVPKSHTVQQFVLESPVSTTDDKIQHQHDDPNLKIKVEEDEGEGVPQKFTKGKDEKKNAVAAVAAASAAPGVSDTLIRKKIDAKKKTAVTARGKKIRRSGAAAAYRNSTTTILDRAAKNNNNNNNNDDQKTTLRTSTAAGATTATKDITRNKEGNKKHPPRGAIELASATGPVERNTTTTYLDAVPPPSSTTNRGNILLASANGPVQTNTTTAYLSDIPPSSSSGVIRSSSTTANRGNMNRGKILLASANGPVQRNTTTAYLDAVPTPSSSSGVIRSSATTTTNRGNILLASANGPVERNTTTAYLDAVPTPCSTTTNDNNNASPAPPSGKNNNNNIPTIGKKIPGSFPSSVPAASVATHKVPQQPLPSLLPPRSIGSGNSVDDVQKNGISLATGSGDVSALPSTTDSAAVNRTSTNDNGSNRGRGQDGRNNNDDDNNVGAFRVGNDDESNGMFSIMTRGASANMVKATPIDATLAPSKDNIEAMEAMVEERIRTRISVAQQVEVTTTTEEGKPRRSSHVRIYFVVCLAIIVAAILAAVFVPKGEEEDKGEVVVTFVDPTVDPTTIMENDTPTLKQIRQRGFLRCGADEFKIGFASQSPANGGSFDGFFLDYCRALAMAILGDPEKIEVLFVTTADRFQRLKDNEIDVLTQTATWTMGRDIFETHWSLGMSFSAPFYYDGMVFAGQPTYVDCADKLDSFTGSCRNLSVCVKKGTTHLSILDKIFPGAEKVLVDVNEEYVSALIDDTCNVVVEDSVAVPESIFRALGYTGPYKVGEKKFSKEPLAIVTRDDDFEFSKMTNMAIEVLYTAEALGITQDTVASDMVELEALQDNGLKSFFVDIISTMGNMGELYERQFESMFPRQGLNFLNEGAGGLIYSFPFGDVENRGELSEGGKISSILQRQKLRCGISRRPGFADFDADLSPLWAGIDAEFCFAVSAALFSTLGARAQVEFVELEASDSADRLDLLARGEIDVLAGERVTLERMWRQNPETYSGYLYSPPYYHDNGTGDLFALVTSSDDSQWSDFVFWVVMSTFYAEERGIQQSDFSELPIVSLFGESVKQMFLDTIWEVGNYGNIYNRTIESMHTRAGRNTLNLGSSPQMLGFPLS